MSRGRGRGGRFRFGGSRDSALADMLDETREDLGLSHTQMELLHVRLACCCSADNSYRVQCVACLSRDANARCGCVMRMATGRERVGAVPAAAAPAARATNGPRRVLDPAPARARAQAREPVPAMGSGRDDVGRDEPCGVCARDDAGDAKGRRSVRPRRAPVEHAERRAVGAHAEPSRYHAAASVRERVQVARSAGAEAERQDQERRHGRRRRRHGRARRGPGTSLLAR